MNKHNHYMSIFLGVSFLIIASLLVVNRPSAQVGDIGYQTISNVSTAPSCGSALGQILSEKPTGDATCSSGSTVEYITSDGSPHWYWTCKNTVGSASCYAIKAISPVCGTANGQTLALQPTSDALCATGSASAIEKNSSGWNWKCIGNNEETVTCHASIFIQKETIVAGEVVPVCGTANGQTLAVQPSNDVLCAKGLASSVEKNSSGWNWKCMGSSSGSFQYCKALLMVTPAQSVNTTTTIDTTAKEITATVANIENDNNDDKDEENFAESNIVTAEIKNTLVSKNVIIENDEPTSLESNSIERSMVLVDPIKVLGRSLSTEDNPKKYGVLNEALKIERVQLSNENNAKGNILLVGKSEPNALVTIFIFSEDPIVITVKANANGDWNYELSHELADGQHETYIAVRDEEGRILSKSEPVAFVKTAQAVNMVPISKLTGNESPVEQSFQQYILMAIIIMSVCLVVALILMGFLSHKQNTNEGIN